MKKIILCAIALICVAGCSKPKPKAAPESPRQEASNDAAKPAEPLPPKLPKEEVKAPLAEETVETIESLGFPLELKYTKLEQKDFVITSRKGQKTIPAKVYYSRTGSVLRIESVAKDTITVRMPPATIRESMEENKEATLEISNNATEQEFQAAWEAINSMYPVSEANEFILTSVRQHFRDLGDTDIYILEIRGFPNPLGITHDMPSSVKDRGRIFFGKDGKYLGYDNML